MNRNELRKFDDSFLREVVNILELPDSFGFTGQKLNINISPEQRSMLTDLVYATKIKRSEFNTNSCSVNETWCEDVLYKYFGIKL